jgi:hypothetical protein
MPAGGSPALADVVYDIFWLFGGFMGGFDEVVLTRSTTTGRQRT